MIRLVDKQKIIHLYRTCGYSRELEISRKTVHKVIVEYECALLSMEKKPADALLRMSSFYRFHLLKAQQPNRKCLYHR